jgi:hypothetical protein
MDLFLTLTNLLALLFWVRLWSQPERELYFNPFLSTPTRLTDRVLDFLRPVLPLPGRPAAFLLIAFVLAFRALFRSRFHPEDPWRIALGLVFPFNPGQPGMLGALQFSLLDFLFFLARFWGVALLVQWLTPVPRRTRASDAFRFFALPFSGLHGWLQPVALCLTHAALVCTLCSCATLDARDLPRQHDLPFALPGPGSNGYRLALGSLTLCSISDLLMVAWHMVFAMLVVSLFAALTRNPLLIVACQEGVVTLLGRFGHRLQLGFLDLSPLLFMASLFLLHHAVVLAVLLAAMPRIV